jgi:hypothetical protein
VLKRKWVKSSFDSFGGWHRQLVAGVAKQQEVFDNQIK